MSVSWLAPLAWAGLALIAVPIAIHLLARRESRRIPFPSLRFVPASTLAALRRRAIADWPLLVLRVLIIALAVAAAAAPVFVSDARRGSWNTRYARALVVTGDSPAVQDSQREETNGSFAARTFAHTHLPDAIRAAARWLRAQPPARREVVVIGDVREGALSRRDFDALEPHVGVRFVPAGEAPGVVLHDAEGVAEMRGGSAARFRLRVTPAAEYTEAVYEPSATARVPQVEIRAAPEEQDIADALQRAVARQGIMLSAGTSRAVSILFDGAEAPAPTVTSGAMADDAAWARNVLAQTPRVRGELRDGVLVLRTPLRVTDPEAPRLVAHIVDLAFTESLSQLEPRVLSAATLAAWSRAAGDSPADILPGDEGDRRWLWLAAIVLMIVEQIVRRRMRVG